MRIVYVSFNKQPAQVLMNAPLLRASTRLSRARLPQICCSDLPYASIHSFAARKAQATDPRIEDISDLQLIEDQFAAIRTDYRE